MSDLDLLDKALDLIEEREEKIEKGEMPEVFDGVVNNVEITTREEIFGSGGKWGKPDDPYVTIYFAVMYDGQELDTGRSSYPISTGMKSKLALYRRKFGRPEVGQEIQVFTPKDSEFWEVDLSKEEL